MLYTLYQTAADVMLPLRLWAAGAGQALAGSASHLESWRAASALCEMVSRARPDDVLVFLFPCMIDGALLLYFLRGFRAPASVVAWAGAPNDDLLSPSPTGRGSMARVGHLVTESADG